MSIWAETLDRRYISMRKVVILGSGCAGNTAAIYSARANLKPLVIEGHEPGGQLSITTEVENFPAFPEGIHGPQLVENMKQQARAFRRRIPARPSRRSRSVASARSRLELEDGEQIETRTLIIATGASARWLNLPNEQKLIGHGVSSCATCDGFFYRGKEIMVVGGGDSAMEEANFLTPFREARWRWCIGSETFRASKIMLERAQANPKIEFITNTVVEDITMSAKGCVTGVKLQNVVTGRRVRTRSGRFLRRDRTHPEHEAVHRPDRSRSGRLHPFAWRRPHQYRGRLPCGRCAGPHVPAGHYGLRRGLHGGHGSRTLSRSGGSLSQFDSGKP